MEAYEELCRRHTDEVTRAANVVANNTQEATDIVFEAFARLLVRIRESAVSTSDLDDSLRLLVRRITLDRHLRTQQWAQSTPRADEPTGDDPEHKLIRRAFDALPDEWQQALWHAEVEQKTDTTLARGLQVSTTEVAARVYRAREVVRQAYLAARLSSGLAAQCRPFAQNMYAFVQRKLPHSLNDEVAGHIERCDSCRANRDTLGRLVSDLRSALFVALLMPTHQGLKSFVADAPGAVTLESLQLPPITPAPADTGGPRAITAAGRSPASARPAAVAPPELAPRRSRALVGLLGLAAAAAVAVTAYVVVQEPGDEPDLTPVAAGTGPLGGAAVQDPGDGSAGLLTVLAETTAPVAEVAPDGTVVPAAAGRDGADVDAGDDVDDVSAGDPDPEASPTATTTLPPGTPDPSPTPTPTPTQSTTEFAPRIDAQPGGASAQPGQDASFSVRVSGEPAPVIQWQERGAGGGWSDVGGATSAQLSVSVPDAGHDGRAYRVLASNALGSVASEAAVLSVEFAPEIVASPNDASVSADGEVYLEASAVANPGVSEVRWQVSAGGGWHDVSASFPAGSSSRLRVTGNDLDSGSGQYRAVFTNSYGSATTNAATVSVTG